MNPLGLPSGENRLLPTSDPKKLCHLPFSHILVSLITCSPLYRLSSVNLKLYLSKTSPHPRLVGPFSGICSRVVQ